MTSAPLIDTHTHFLPARLAQAVRTFFADAGVPPLRYPADLDGGLVDHVDAGFDAIWNLPYAHRPGIAAGLNQAMLEMAEAHRDLPVRIVTGCTVHPGDADPAGDLRRAVAAGARVLKLHCSVGSYGHEDPGLAPALEAAGELGVPVVLHLGHAPDGTTAAHDLDGVGRVAAAHPGTTIIMAHTAHPATSLAIALMCDHPNLWADLTPVLFQPVAVDAAQLTALADRVLLGSDCPNVGISLPEQLARLRDMGLDPAHEAAITGGNAARLVPLDR